MKVRIGTLRRIVAEEIGDAKSFLGMSPSKSIPDGRSEIWKDQDAAAAHEAPKKNAQSKKDEMEALKQRIAILRKAREEAENRLRQLSASPANEAYLPDALGQNFDTEDMDVAQANVKFPGAMQALAAAEGLPNVARLDKYFQMDVDDNHALIAQEKASGQVYVWNPTAKSWSEE